MGYFITILISIFAIACIALLIYSKIKEVRGKGCAGCDKCDKNGGCEGCSFGQSKSGEDVEK